VAPTKPVVRAEHRMVSVDFMSLPDTSSERNMQERKIPGPQVNSGQAR